MSRLVLVLLLVLFALPASAQPVLVPPGSTCLVRSEGLDCTPPAPPATYPLTLPVTGSGSTAGAGSYQAGVSVQINSTPATGSTFTSWSGPAPCPQTATTPATVTMPANALACTAMFAQSQPPPTSGAWDQRGPTCVSGDCWGWGFQGWGWDAANARLLSHWPAGNAHVVAWQAPGAFDWWYQPGAAVARVTREALPRPGPPRSVPARRMPAAAAATDPTPGVSAHNCAQAFDQVNNLLWLGNCGPQPNPGSYYVNMATHAYTRYDPGPNAVQTNALMVYSPDAKAIYALGGYSNTAKAVLKLPVIPLPTSAAAWQTLPFANGPGITYPENPAESGMRLTYTRGGYDPNGKFIWLIDGAMDYWSWTEAGGWNRAATSGPKPPNATVFALDTVARVIVGWAGIDQDAATPIRKTSILDLATKTWSEGPYGPTGTPVATTLAGMGGFTGPDGRAHFAISNQGWSIWRYTPGTGPTPPPTTYPVSATITPAAAGTVSGQGGFAAGSPVTLTFAPVVSGSTHVWSGASVCVGSSPTLAFTMPSAAVACTVTVTPPAASTYSLTTVATGPGTTSVTPAGKASAGTVRTLTATPNAGAQKQGGWAPSPPCGDTVTQPASDVTCSQAFTGSTPPPTSQVPPLDTMPDRTFMTVGCGPTESSGKPIYDQSAWACDSGSKHMRWADKEDGTVWTGFGDQNPSHHGGNTSQNQGYRLVTRTGAWSRWNAACRASGIQPSYPDEVSWGWDRRGSFWLLPGVLQGSDGVTCNSGGGEQGATLYRTGLFRYTPATDTWDRFTTGDVQGTDALWGNFDNVTKSLMFWSTGGCGSVFNMLNVDTRVRTFWDLCLSTDPYPGAVWGNFEAVADGRIEHWAFDEVGRTAYFVTHHTQTVNHNPEGYRIRAWKMNVDTRQVTRLPDPPNTAPSATPYSTPDMQVIAWDTKNKVVLYPYSKNSCGFIESMHVYNPVSNAWESYPVTPTPAVQGGAVRGNSAVYDSMNNVLILGGSNACADSGYPNQPWVTNYFVWRYKK